MASPADRQIDEAFGLVLTRLRHERGLSQEALGHGTNSGRTYVSQLERGKRGASLKTLFRFANHLGVAPSEIVRLVEDKMVGPSSPFPPKDFLAPESPT